MPADLRRRAIPALLLAALASCAPAPPPSGEDFAPPVELRLPVVQEPVARLIALHGFSDRKAAFDGLAAFAADNGIIVESWDQRGFGANPDRGRWPGKERLAADLIQRVRESAVARPELPVYVLGESMGAAVAILAASMDPDLPVAGLILSAPAVWGGDTLNPFYRSVLWLASHIAPGMTVTGRGLGILASDNIEMLRELGRDPLYIHAPRIDAIAGLVDLMDAAFDHAPDLKGPLLVLFGERDEVILPEVHRRFIARLKASECTALAYDDGWHLLLRDLQRKTVWRDIVRWMKHEPPTGGRPVPCGAPPAD